MKYGGELADPCLNEFKVNISEILNRRTSYTKEEQEFAQRLVNLLASSVDYDLIKKEDAKKLRLEKQLRKSKIKR